MLWFCVGSALDVFRVLICFCLGFASIPSSLCFDPALMLRLRVRGPMTVHDRRPA